MRWVKRGLMILGAVFLLALVVSVVGDFVYLHQRVGRLENKISKQELDLIGVKSDLDRVCRSPSVNCSIWSFGP